MTVFFAAAAVAAVLAIVLILSVFLHKPAAGGASRRLLNAAIYREQLARIEQDRAQGTLAAGDFEQARAELQRRLLEDTRDEDVAAVLRAPKKTIAAIAIVLPLAAGALYAVLGNPDALNPAREAPHAVSQEIERMVATLAAKLEANPDNPAGWVMLARSYKAMGRPVDAEKAFARAGAFIDGDAQALAAYADLAATNANGDFSGKPAQLIDKALKIDPDNPMALWLAGTAAFKSADYDKAVRLWSRLVQLLPPDSDDARTLRSALDDARARGGNGDAPTPATAASAGVAGTITGTLTLDPGLKARTAPDDVVMIVARAPASRVPVAVLRARVADLPLKFILDDSLSMMPQARLSAATEVAVEARISKSGMANPESGDLFAEPRSVKVGTRGLGLTVDRIRP